MNINLPFYRPPYLCVLFSLSFSEEVEIDASLLTSHFL